MDSSYINIVNFDYNQYWLSILYIGFALKAKAAEMGCPSFQFFTLDSLRSTWPGTWHHDSKLSILYIGFGAGSVGLWVYNYDPFNSLHWILKQRVAELERRVREYLSILYIGFATPTP